MLWNIIRPEENETSLLFSSQATTCYLLVFNHPKIKAFRKVLFQGRNKPTYGLFF